VRDKKTKRGEKRKGFILSEEACNMKKMKKTTLHEKRISSRGCNLGLAIRTTSAA